MLTKKKKTRSGRVMSRVFCAAATRAFDPARVNPCDDNHPPISLYPPNNNKNLCIPLYYIRLTCFYFNSIALICEKRKKLTVWNPAVFAGLALSQLQFAGLETLARAGRHCAPDRLFFFKGNNNNNNNI